METRPEPVKPGNVERLRAKLKTARVSILQSELHRGLRTPESDSAVARRGIRVVSSERTLCPSVANPEQVPSFTFAGQEKVLEHLGE